MKNLSMKTLYIIGIGMGNESLLTKQAIDTAGRCERLLATGRAGENFPQSKTLTLSGLYEELEKDTALTTGVLASGDAGFFSLSKSLTEKLSECYDIRIINGLNSLQYFTGRLNMPYDDVKVCSMHGRNTSIVSKVCYNKKVFVLTGGEYKVARICGILADSGLGGVRVYVGENLSYETETIVKGTADELKNSDYGDLSVMLIENENIPDIYANLNDDDFCRGKTPMTKEDVRNIIVAKLGIRPNEIVYDIGAGTGSVSVALARKATDGVVYAVENDEEAIGLIEENKRKLLAFNINVVKGEAPEALAGLPAPDAVFIGGSGGNFHEILAVVRKKNAGARIAATAVTLQTLAEITGCGPVTCVNVSKSKKLGAYDMMFAQNPIYVAELRS